MYDKRCKSCGRLLSEFYETGILGCPDCYKAFEEEIMPTVREIQGNTFHTGKTPTYSNIDKELLTEYKALLSEREKAGIEGRFSDMAEISKEISSLYEELKNRGLV